MMLRMVREIKLSSDWFGCVLVISFYVAMVFSESVTWSSSCFTNVKLFAISASYTVDNFGGGVREVISDLNGYIGSRHFLYSDMVKENLYPRAKSLYLSVDVFFSLACVALFSLCSSC